jgi:hypothetical protein
MTSVNFRREGLERANGPFIAPIVWLMMPTSTTWQQNAEATP